MVMKRGSSGSGFFGLGFLSFSYYRSLGFYGFPFFSLVFAFFLFLLVSWSLGLRTLVLQAMADVFLQVGVFVAATLLFISLFEHIFRINIGHFLSRFLLLQPFFAALLGAFPGCGGAIIVVIQYTKGYITFGSLVSVLISTMGDAVFLLIANEFYSGIVIILIGIVTGSLTGLIVDKIHGSDFMRPAYATGFNEGCNERTPGSISLFFPSGILEKSWLIIVLLGLFLGVMLQLQVKPETFWLLWLTEEQIRWIALSGSILMLGMWLSSGIGFIQHSSCSVYGDSDGVMKRVISDTNFVMGWAFLGFLSYGVSIYWLGQEVSVLFSGGLEVFVPLLAILVGFLPGCGPQIVVTSLYVSGAIPFSAQIGNAISNDGDALFPAIALVPRAAILATLYSAIPAVFVAYGWYLFFES